MNSVISEQTPRVKAMVKGRKKFQKEEISQDSSESIDTQQFTQFGIIHVNIYSMYNI